MYLGRIVGRKRRRDSLYALPTHPYTQALLSAIPVPDPAACVLARAAARRNAVGPVNPPPGCPFHPRCAYTRSVAATLDKKETVSIVAGGEPARIVARCTREIPRLAPLPDDPSHYHACLLKQG